MTQWKLDPLCPVSHRMVACLPFLEGGGNRLHDLTGNLRGINFGAGVAGPRWNKDGTVRFDNANTQYIKAENASVFNFGTGSFSVAIDFRINPGDDYANIIMYDWGSGTCTWWGIIIDGEPARLKFYVDDGVNVRSVAAGAGLDDGRRHDVLFSRAADGRMKAILDGVLKDNQIFAPVANIAGNGAGDIFWTGAAGSGDTDNYKGDCGYFYAWGRVVSEAEAIRIHENPRHMIIM